MDDRERRDFDAGLREEVDAWLRGDSSRRTFLTRLVLMGGAAMVPGFGFTAGKAWADAVDLSKVELADPSHAAGPGPDRRGEGVDGKPDRRLGLSRRAGGAEIQGRHHQHDL